MSSQREKIYQKIFASNVFSTEQTNRASTGKKVSPMKNRDHFATLAKPPSKAVLQKRNRLIFLIRRKKKIQSHQG